MHHRPLLLVAAAALAGCATGPTAAPTAGGASGLPPGAALELALPASFTGTLPCADCEGIDYRLDLFVDRSFYLRTTYRGRAPGTFDDVGSFDWSSDRRVLIAQGGREAPLSFSLESGDEIRLLDRAGQPVDSKLDYSLRRASGLAPLEPRLALRGMYRYLADAAIFEECSTGRRLPVAMEADNVALERGYREAGAEPGAPVMALVEGRIAQRMPMERPGPVATLVPERFLRMAPGETCPPRFATAPLEGTAWQLVSLGGEAVTVGEGRPRPGLTLDAATARAGGSDGCNRFTGGYTLDRDRLAFGQLASTMMACVDGMDVAQRYTAALGATVRCRALGAHLELYDAAGAVLARFEARPAAE
jgi:copper homeostasis protein (lipoprotein)